MGERLAFVLTAGKNYRESPMSLFENGSGGLRLIEGRPGENPVAGWGICPDDGRNYASLLEAAMKRITGGAAGPLRKGEKEWTATGSLS